MSKFNCIEYQNVYLGTIRFNSFGQITTNVGIYRKPSVKNKIACFCVDSPKTLASEYLNDNTTFTCYDGEKLFISPKCRISRDLYRNSGFKIVRNRENADRIILPALPLTNQYLYYDVIMFTMNEGGSLYLMTVNRNEDLRAGMEITPEEDFKTIKYFFENNYRYDSPIWFQEKLLKNAVCQFIPKCNEYTAILTDESPDYSKYLFEQDVPYKCPIQINLETLRVWRYCVDGELMAKSLCNSDWQKYPACLCAFLKQEHPEIIYYGGQNTKLVLSQIGFDAYSSLNAMLDGRTISPQDWNLLQDYIMDKVNVSESGGYVDKKLLIDNSVLRDCIRERFAVAPLKINTPILYENLCQMLI